MEDLLEKLGLEKEASWNEVKRAYFSQLKLWHPDRFSSDEKMRKQGEERTKLINEVFGKIKEIVANYELSNERLDTEASLIEQIKFVEFPFFVEEKELETSVLEKKRNYRQESMIGLRKVESKFGQFVEDEAESKISLFVGGAFAFVALVGTLAFIGFVNFNQTKIIRKNPVAQSSAAKSNSAENKIKEKVSSKKSYQTKSQLQKVSSKQMPNKKRESKFDISNRLKKPSPAIISAAMRCDKNAISRQLSKGIAVDFKDDKGMTALSWAARRNCVGLAKYLISKGSNTGHISFDGQTPLQIARRFNNIDIVKVLELDAPKIKRKSLRKLRR